MTADVLQMPHLYDEAVRTVLTAHGFTVRNVRRALPMHGFGWTRYVVITTGDPYAAAELIGDGGEPQRIRTGMWEVPVNGMRTVVLSGSDLGGAA